MRRFLSVLVLISLCTCMLMPISVAAKTEVNTEHLEAKIAEFENLNPRDWNSRLFLYVRLEVKAANRLLASGLATQGEIDAAYVAITRAIANLEPKPTPTPIQRVDVEDFGKVEDLYPEGYTGMIETKDPSDTAKEETRATQKGTSANGGVAESGGCEASAATLAVLGVLSVLGTALVCRRHDD